MWQDLFYFVNLCSHETICLEKLELNNPCQLVFRVILLAPNLSHSIISVVPNRFLPLSFPQVDGNIEFILLQTNYYEVNQYDRCLAE